MAVFVATWPEIEPVALGLDLERAMREGFLAYSSGRCVVPPVGELLLEDPPGDVHIKYGYVRGDDYYVIKIASGFPGNPARGLPVGNGMMLLFRQDTGETSAVLLDDGNLTQLRTAAAGALVARTLAPSEVWGIGIIGTGEQARLQLRFLKAVMPCRAVWVWGRRGDAVDAFQRDMTREGFQVTAAASTNEVAANCNLIVTATAAEEPLLGTDSVQPGTHVTAMGSDTPTKQELESGLLARADQVVADSVAQCRLRGEISHALKTGYLEEHDVVELGAVLAGEAPGRSNDSQITIADLTGVAVQDVQIAAAVYRELRG